ncbi:MAG: hypothetical protein ACRDO7_14550 [Nocardioidaceae bacterium]
MSRVEEFDAFYDSTRQYVLHLTYALAGDVNVAAVAVRDAYADTWQGWSKLRNRDPLSFVRSESWRQAVLQRSTHLLRRKHAPEGDQALLDALHDLPGNARRLLVLQTIGELNLDDTAREVGLTEETAASATSIARSAVERKLGVSRYDMESRLRDLRLVTDQVAFERPSLARRRAGKRGRRRTVAIVVAGVLAVGAAGVVVTQGGPLDNARELANGVRQLPTPPVDSLAMSDDDMLDEPQIGRIDPTDHKWQVSSTDTDIGQRDNLSTCPAHRLADRRAAAGWVRTYEPKNFSNEYAVQSLEVSRNKANAKRGFQQTVRWYADCAVPRLQLMKSYSVEHKNRDTVIMRMRRWDKPVRTYTIGISRSDVVTTAVVHETEGMRGPAIGAFSRTIDDSLSSLCEEKDKSCKKPGKVKPTLPPETSTATGFLGVIDLPPVTRIDDLWVGTDPGSADPNTSATQCDRTEFTGKAVEEAQARTFLIPEADELSETPFGISQTVGSFVGPRAAEAFASGIIERVDGCSNLAATVRKGHPISAEGVTGKTWQLTLELSEKNTQTYRLGVARAGDLVTQVTFLPEEKYDIRDAGFNALVERAGERLRTRGTSAATASGPADDQ